MSVVDRAKALRPVIEKAAQSLTDEEALSAIELYPSWSGDGIFYFVDFRVRYIDGFLYTCITNHVSQPGWTPADAPSLWAKVLIPDPGSIPVWEQPDSTNPYMKGDKVHYPSIEDPVYESVIDNNVWSPEAYPAGWALVEDNSEE